MQRKVRPLSPLLVIDTLFCQPLLPSGLTPPSTRRHTFPPQRCSELPRQLNFITSSQKKRKITRQSTGDHDTDNLSDSVLPSTEEDSDPTFSFSAASTSGGLSTPTYVRGDSLPPSGLPSRLQTQLGFLPPTDFASSAASSPVAASADLSVDNDRAEDAFDSDHASVLHPPQGPARKDQPPVALASHRAIMGGAAELPHQRSSSPLKRRASSMDSDVDCAGRDDVDMISLPPVEIEPAENGNEPDGANAKWVETGDGTSESPMPGLVLDPEEPIFAAPLSNNEPPPVAEQIATIERLVQDFHQSRLAEGNTAYLVSRSWLARAQAQAGSVGPSKNAVDEPLGPVDNADIIEEIVKNQLGEDCVRLKPGMGRENFELFPREAWELMVSWYGLVEYQFPIIREAHDTAPEGTTSNFQFEFHPPVFTFHRLWSRTAAGVSTIETEAPITPPLRFMCSSSVNFNQFLKVAKERAGIPRDRKVRLWLMPRKLRAGTASNQGAKITALSTPPDSPTTGAEGADADNPQDSWPRLFVDSGDFINIDKSDRELLTGPQDRTNDESYNGHSTLAFFSLTVDGTIVLDEELERNVWVSTDRSKASGKEKAVATRVNGLGAASQSRATTSGRNSPSPQGPVTRGRSKQKSGRTLGCVGLGNLGNTCYMNSALQCVRSVEELTKYFLVHEYKREINSVNRLGHYGAIARVYGDLLDDIYRDPPTVSSVVPRTFKNTVSKSNTSFSGYGQQDSQEFLGFLLDALQEDLSRVPGNKPYIVKPESTDEMIGDDAAIREMAEQVWDITKRRDDSVIADLFTGMYKSTLICPVCEKVSITFDPFNTLTLPLPIQNTWTKSMRYYPLNDNPVIIDVDLDKTSSIRAMKEFVSARVGVPTERLFAAEEWKEKFFKIYEDFSCVSDEIQNADTPVMFELEAVPTNVGAKVPKKKKFTMLNPSSVDEEMPSWDSPLAERMVVTVVHRFDPGEPTRRWRTPKGGVSVTPPHVIMLTPQEARSEDAIRRKILEKVATFSTWSAFHEDVDADDNTDADLVIATASDADSAGDGKVVAKSVEGEDDMVDVTMKNASSPKYPKLLRKFNNRRPNWVTDEGAFLSPHLQNLFAMSYFREEGATIPSGWSSVQETVIYPRLETRIPTPAVTDTWPDGVDVPGSDDDSDQEDLPPVTAASATRMATESDSDEDISTIGSAYHDRGSNKVGHGGLRIKPQRTYGKKGNNKRRNKQLQRASRRPPQTSSDSYSSEAAETAADDGPLVRLGDGIVVDWSADAWEMVYGEASGYGAPTFADLPTLDDTELVEKRKVRKQRRQTGLTLDECLDEFEKEEILSENDTWYCPRCKEHRRAAKKFDLWKTPDVLVVHLKRFSSTGWRRDKIDTKVDFPIEELDLTTRVLDKQTGKEEVYELIAVDDHWGGLGGGHYTAFAKNFVDNEWYEYNDSSVMAVKSTDRIVTSAAYLLFYRRRSDIPLGGPRFQTIADKFDNNDTCHVSEDEEMGGSGEGQRLDTGSSQLGSSSAFNGAEATHLRAGPGLASSASSNTLNAGADANQEDYLPTYQQASGTGGDPGDLDDGVSLLGTSVLNFGNQRKDEDIQRSIEDEGVVLGDHWQQPRWDFKSIAGKLVEVPLHGSQNSSDTDVSSTCPGVGDLDEPMSFNTPEGFAEPGEFPSEEFPDNYQLPPEPDPVTQANMAEIQDQAWSKAVLIPPPEHLGGGDDTVSDKAVEIHVGEDENARSD